MGVRVLYDAERSQGCWYDSVSGWAFGPVVEDAANVDVRGLLHAFDQFMGHQHGIDDPRRAQTHELVEWWSEFCAYALDDQGDMKEDLLLAYAKEEEEEE